MNWKYEKNFTEKGYLMHYQDSGKRNSERTMVCQFRIELLKVEPVVWRRIQVPAGLEGFIYREKGVKYPICIDGERACPPEDCGGPDRYSDMLKALSNPGTLKDAEVPYWVEKWDMVSFRKEDVIFDNPYKRWRKAYLEP